MANVFDSGLVAATISRETLTVLSERLAKLSLFSSDFSNEVKKPRDTINVAIASDTGSTVTNPTNFAPAPDTTLTKTSVEMNHLAQFFGISEVDLSNGHRLEQLVKINAQKFADAIWAAAITPITSTNFQAATVTGIGSVAPDSDDLKALWGAVAKSDQKGLVLDAVNYANFIPQNSEGLMIAPGAYGFEQGIHYATTFPTGETNLSGFACSPDAIAIAAAAPALDSAVSQNFFSSEVITLEQLGLSIYSNVYGDSATRQVTASMEVMFGSSAAVTDGTMALIVSAA